MHNAESQIFLKKSLTKSEKYDIIYIQQGKDNNVMKSMKFIKSSQKTF